MRHTPQMFLETRHPMKFLKFPREGSIDCLSDGGGGGGGEQLKFPLTTRWVVVSNDGDNCQR